MQLIDLETVKKNLTMPMAIEAIEQLLSIQDKHPDWIKCPERLVIPTFQKSQDNSTGSHLSMPAIIYDGDKEHSVVKLVTICPDNPNRNLPTTTAIINVSNNATGEILAVMDGIYVTQVRTAALSGIATKYLAMPDSHTVAVLGCGGMAYEQLNAVLTVCPNIKQVNLWNRTVEGAHEFKTKFTNDYSKWSVTLNVTENIDDALQDADIINLATRSTEGLFSLDAIKPQVHINAVGAYLPEMQEVSNEVTAACSHVVIDDKAGGKHEAGDLIQADADVDSDWTWDDLSGELMDLVTQKIKIDHDKKGVSLFKSVGAASFDAAVALKVALLAVDEDIGQRIKW